MSIDVAHLRKLHGEHRHLEIWDAPPELLDEVEADAKIIEGLKLGSTALRERIAQLEATLREGANVVEYLADYATRYGLAYGPADTFIAQVAALANK